MHLRKFFGCLLLTLSACALTLGCSGSGAYEQGKRFMADGQYDDAAVSFRRAIAEEPGNQQYLNALDQAEARAADQHYARAEQFWKMNRVTDAADELDRVFAFMPAHPNAMKLKDPVNQRIAQANRLTDGARDAFDKGNRSQAENLVREALKFDASHPGALQLARRLNINTPAMPEPVAQEPPPEPIVQDTPPPPPVQSEPVQPEPIRSSPPVQTVSPQPGIEKAPGGLRRVTRITLSRDNPLYPKRVNLQDGIRVHLKDTDDGPIDADIEIHVGDTEVKEKDLPVGTRMDVRGLSGQVYIFTIVSIIDEDETIILDMTRHDGR